MWGEEAGFGGVGGDASTSDRRGREFAELVGGEFVLGVGEDVFIEQVGAEHGWIVRVEGDEEAGSSRVTVGLGCGAPVPGV